MGTNLSGAVPTPHHSLNQDEILDWIENKIKEGDYSGIIDWLQSSYTFQGIGTGSNPINHTVVDLCKICQQQLEDTEASWEIFQRSVSQQKALNTNLANLISHLLNESLLYQSNTPSSLKVTKKDLQLDTATQSEHPKLWQKLQAYIGLSKEPLAPQKPTVHEPKPNLLQEHVNTPQRKRPLMTIYCFGSFRVYINGQLINNWKGIKSKSILKYLVFNSRPIHREQLMNVFWQDEEPDAAKRNLYQTIYVLRQALKADMSSKASILCESSTYFINPEFEVWIDSESFRTHYEKGKKLVSHHKTDEAIHEFEAADSLYEGEFLPEDLYENWLITKREDYRYMYLDLTNQLSQIFLERQQYAMSITFARKTLSEDTCREDAHRRLMRAYYNLGQRHLAIRQYHLCTEALKQELDVEPMPATINLYHQIQ